MHPVDQLPVMIGGDYKGPAMVYMRTNTPSRLGSQGGFDGERFADQHLAAEGRSAQTGGILDRATTRQIAMSGNRIRGLGI